MIQTGSIEKGSISFRVLTDDQVAEIKRASYDVMVKVGFRYIMKVPEKCSNRQAVVLKTNM